MRSHRQSIARLAKLFGLPALLLATAAQSSGAETIQIAYPEETGIVQGPGHFAFDFLRAAEMVVDDSGLKVKWTPLPVARLVHQVRIGAADFCVGGAGITADREAAGLFSRPFINDRLVAVLALKGRRETLAKAREFKELAAMDGLRFLAMNGANYGAMVTPLMAQLKDRISTVPRNTEQMLDMLQRGRADFGLVMKTYTDNYLAARPDRDKFILVSYPDLRRDFSVAFWCSRAIPAGTIDALNAAIARQLPKIREQFPEQRLDSN